MACLVSGGDYKFTFGKPTIHVNLQDFHHFLRPIYPMQKDQKMPKNPPFGIGGQIVNRVHSANRGNECFFHVLCLVDGTGARETFSVELRTLWCCWKKGGGKWRHLQRGCSLGSVWREEWKPLCTSIWKLSSDNTKFKTNSVCASLERTKPQH